MTKPMTPAGCDLSDFAFMPLDVARLRDSELASNESPEACWAAVLLWAASWHQVPAASIPNDDKWLAKHAGYGRVVAAWIKVRAGALRGWVECDDGRLYHPVVAEKAIEAWNAKLAQRWRSECARIKKHNQRHETKIEALPFDEWLSSGCPQGQHLFVPKDKTPGPDDVPRETPSKRQGEGQGQGQPSSEAKASDAADAPAASNPKSPDEMAKAELWRAAVSVLEQGGCPPSQCRTFMGKLVGDYTFPVVQQAIASAVAQQPADAREYLKATCQRLKGERKDPLTVPSNAAEQTKALLDSYEMTPEQKLLAAEARFRALGALKTIKRETA